MGSRSVTAAWNQLRVYPARMVAVILAITLGVGFVVATLVFGATFRAALGDSVSARYTGADVVVTDPDGTQSDGAEQAQLLNRIAALPAVDHAEFQPFTWPTFASAEARGTIRVDTLPQDERLRWFEVTDGYWPSSDQQILVDRTTAATTGLQVGDTLTLATDDGRTPQTVTVSGIADTSASAFSGAGNQAFVPASLMSALSPGGLAGPMVAIAEPGTSADELRDAIAAVAPAGLSVLTGAEQSAKAVAQITGGATVLTIVLLGFAVIAVVASGIVIANTFTILLTQRRRHIALTRCIGGSRVQVRREVLAEAALVGTIGSLIGIGLGIAVGAVGGYLVGFDATRPAVPGFPIVLTGLGGIAFTTLAAYAPASRAMRIPPLAALRPVPDAAEQHRSSVLRVTVAAGLTGFGVLLLVLAVAGPSLLLGMAGGALSACGILLLTRTFLPAMVRVVGRLAGVFGAPGRLAAANAHRNPGRAAATTAALMLGVGLIVTLQVGTASAQVSLDRAVDARYPVDIAVTSSGSAIPSSVIAAVTGADGVRAGGGLPASTVVSIGAVGGEPEATDGLMILGVTPEAAGALGSAPDGLADDSVIVPSYLLSAGLAVGDRMTIRTPSGTGDFTVATGALAHQGINGDALVTTAAALRTLEPAAPTLAVWAGVDAGADLSELTATVNRIVAAQPDLALGGSAPERAAVSSSLDTIITLATALLAVAVIIAIVGIGNTLGLSVIERTRESALLRALGLHRRQLRYMLAIEAALLAGVGAAVGVLAGIGYGFVGVASAFGEAGESLVLDIPWGQLAAVLVLAILAALLASVLPARRAAKATPTQALAEG